MNDRKKVLITGAGGFIGKSLTRTLIEQGYKVLAIDICDIPESLIPYSDDINWINESFINIIDDPEFYETNIKKGNVEYAIHLATTLFPSESVNKIEDDCYENVFCTVKLFSNLYSFGCKKILYASSGGTVYGFNENNTPFYEYDKLSPEIPYGLTKATCEQYLRLLSKKYDAAGISIRISNPYGEEQRLVGNQGVIPIFMNKIYTEAGIEVFGNIESKRDYIYIDDLIDGFVKCLDYLGDQDVFNLCYGKSYSVKDIISILESKLHKKAKIMVSDKSNGPVKNVILANELARKELNWYPKVNLESGIKALVLHHDLVER
ncbi:NAD-dependent epimerase/dehydratase family protein [Photobacterium sp. MCCC 1A19761]|uniref:NAD-dependent epimerase/dehydratase family protein n=1 Tax=Photobacterium sp. MCCC 1A19761 TaxID=3115000 RepID=UPI00307DBEC4